MLSLGTIAFELGRGMPELRCLSPERGSPPRRTGTTIKDRLVPPGSIGNATGGRTYHLLIVNPRFLKGISIRSHRLVRMTSLFTVNRVIHSTFVEVLSARRAFSKLIGRDLGEWTFEGRRA